MAECHQHGHQGSATYTSTALTSTYMSWRIVDLHSFCEPSIRLDAHLVHVRHRQVVALDRQKGELLLHRSSATQQSDTHFKGTALRVGCSPGKIVLRGPQTEAAEPAPSFQSRLLPIQQRGEVGPCLQILLFHSPTTLSHARAVVQ